MFRPQSTLRRPTLWFPQVTAWAAIALATCALHSTVLAQSGKWSSVASWETGSVPLHLALVRGDGNPFHSRIVWWGTTLYSDPAGGGIIGWRADGLGCGTFPDTTGATPTFDPLHPWAVNENLFCSALTQLADGKVYSLGGSYPNSAGLRSTWTYDGSSGGTNLGTWTQRGSMAQHRWYPTAISLRDGRMFVSAGHKYAHLWSYGGRRDGALPSVANGGHLLDRTGRIVAGNWDPSVLTTAAVAEVGRPTPREGHTLAYMPVLQRPTMFGGKDSTGKSIDPPLVWYLARSDGGDLDADYQYPWHLLTVTGTAPPARHDHAAVTVSDAEMIVFGGVKKTANDSTALGDLWRLHRNAQQQWQWLPVTVTSGDAPSARFGHTMVADTHTYVPAAAPAYLVRRLLIYGGTTPGNAATDLKVYTFTFGSDFTSGTWSSLTPSGAFLRTTTTWPMPARGAVGLGQPGMMAVSPGPAAQHRLGLLVEAVAHRGFWREHRDGRDVPAGRESVHVDVAVVPAGDERVVGIELARLDEHLLRGAARGAADRLHASGQSHGREQGGRSQSSHDPPFHDQPPFRLNGPQQPRDPDA